jgi:hypothetical protein
VTPVRRLCALRTVVQTFVLAGVASLYPSASALAQPLTEGFDTVTNGVPNSNWFTQNNSVSPSQPYFQGNPAVFAANSGATNSYIGVNFQSTSATDATGDTISNWLVTPQLTPLNNGDIVSFFTRTTTGTFPDRLELRLSMSGASTNVGTLPTDVGDFTTLLLTVNPNLDNTSYPTAWTQFSVTLSGLSGPTSGRFGFRYYVTDGGPDGPNSDYIGIDDFGYTPSPVPEPSSMALVGAVVFGSAGLRRRFVRFGRRSD